MKLPKGADAKICRTSSLYGAHCVCLKSLVGIQRVKMVSTGMWIRASWCISRPRKWLHPSGALIATARHLVDADQLLAGWLTNVYEPGWAVQAIRPGNGDDTTRHKYLSIQATPRP